VIQQQHATPEPLIAKLVKTLESSDVAVGQSVSPEVFVPVELLRTDVADEGIGLVVDLLVAREL